ncbi:hypothetical protein [Azospirillum sp. sgz301742]
MTVVLTYAAVALLAVSIIVSRTARRQLTAARKALATDEAALIEAGQALQEALRAQHDAEQRHTGLESRMEQAQGDVRAAQQVLDAARRIPAERHHVFDRMEPRPGSLWAVTVTRSPGTPPATAPWTGERTWIVAAASQSDATERVTLRYPRSAGFEVRAAVPCPLFATGDAAPHGGKRLRD